MYNKNGTIKIAKIIMQETGTYNPVFRRPYQTQDISHSLLENVGRRVEALGAGTITPGVFSGIASQILAPATDVQGNIFVPNGWGEKRLRFVMEVHCDMGTGSLIIYYFQGYTSHFGLSMSNLVDPTMKFHVNSYVRVSRTQTYGQTGFMTSDIVTESAQIIDGKIVNQLGQSNFAMRPQDVFGMIQTNYLRAADGGQVNDTRGVITNNSLLSKRENNLATNYLASVMSNFSNQTSMASYGVDKNDIISRCIQNAYENAPTDVDFFRIITNLRGYSMESPTSFSYSELMSLDPTVDSRVNIFKYSQAIKRISTDAPLGFNQHNAGSTSDWDGSNRETLVATMLADAVPGIMMELMIDYAWFEIRNDFAGGKPVVLPKKITSMTNADASAAFNLFNHRLITELFSDLTYGGNDIIYAEIAVDIYGEISIKLSINGRALTDYRIPAFCDGLFTPVINPNPSNCYRVCQEIEQLCNVVTQATQTSAPTIAAMNSFNNII